MLAKEVDMLMIWKGLWAWGGTIGFELVFSTQIVITDQNQSPRTEKSSHRDFSNAPRTAKIEDVFHFNLKIARLSLSLFPYTTTFRICCC